MFCTSCHFNFATLNFWLTKCILSFYLFLAPNPVRFLQEEMCWGPEKIHISARVDSKFSKFLQRKNISLIKRRISADPSLGRHCGSKTVFFYIYICSCSDLDFRDVDHSSDKPFWLIKSKPDMSGWTNGSKTYFWPCTSIFFKYMYSVLLYTHTDVF